MNTGNEVITGPHFITTRPTTAGCRHCGRPKLEATVGGIDRHIDPAPLTAAGELAALLAGRATYNLAGPLSDHLIRRTAHHIRGADRRLPIVADHRCVPPPAIHIDHGHLQIAADLLRRLNGQQCNVSPDQPAY